MCLNCSVTQLTDILTFREFFKKRKRNNFRQWLERKGYSTFKIH